MYCAKDDLIARYGEEEMLDLLEDSDGNLDQVMLDQALADTAALIDGYLAEVCTLPLAPVPPLLVRISCEICRYYLYDDAVTDQVAGRYKAALKLLEQLAAGKLSLPSITGSALNESSPDLAQSSAPPVVFDDGKLERF